MGKPIIVEGKATKKNPKVKGDPIEGRCNAITRSNTYCERYPMENGRCYLHGGATPKGIENANFKHGKYSRDVPSRLAARYEQAERDPELLSLTGEIALMDARISELIGSLSSGGVTFGTIAKLWGKLETAVSQKDQAQQRVHLAEIGNAIRLGEREIETWEHISQAIETRRRLVESQNKRNRELEQNMTAAQALTVFGAILAIIKRNVTDQATRNVISREISSLIN